MTERRGSDTAPDQSATEGVRKPPAARVATGESRTQGGGQGSAQTGAQSGAQGGAEATGMTERINAAYASSGPVLPDEATAKPTAAQRLAAVRAGSASRSRGAGAKPAPPAATKATRVRKARLRLTHIDPWSVMKTAFLLAVALGIVTVVAVSVVWWVLDAAGVWVSINQAVGDVVGESGSGFRIEDYLGLSRVLGFTMLVAVIDVILITVIATLGAFLYNLAAALLGGLEVVLAEEDR